MQLCPDSKTAELINDVDRLDWQKKTELICLQWTRKMRTESFDLPNSCRAATAFPTA